MLLDEPTAHLDAGTERVIVETVRELGAQPRRRRRRAPAGAGRAAHRVVTLPVPRPPGPVLPGPARGPVHTARRTVSTSHATGCRADTFSAGWRRRRVALTATAGWLIVEASYQPPILTLLVAIVAVRTFGIARPVLRYAERLRSHDVGLQLLARRRVEVYDAVVPLTPGALGRRRGDLLAAVVDDVDSVLDRELRVRMPVRGFAITALIAVVFTAFAAPEAVPVVLGVCLAGAAGYALARAGAARAERDAVATRARLSDAVVEATQTASELAMWQAEDRALDRVDAVSADLGRRTVTAATWLATGRAWCCWASGLGVAALPRRCCRGSLGPMLALLVLLPLALGEVAAGLADAGALAARTRAAEDRLAALAARLPAVADPDRPLPGAGRRDLALDGVGRGLGRPGGAARPRPRPRRGGSGSP